MFRRPQYGHPPASSGIAQMHKSIDDTNGPAPDPMNLDDFLVPNSIASPAGFKPPLTDNPTRAANKTAALPIKTKKDAQHSTPSTLTPGSVPHPLTRSGRAGEFGYVERRVRKTSVDERRVSGHGNSAAQALSCPNALTPSIRLESGLLNFPLKYLRQPYR
jgi:GATA-binding protein, other eukaryote